MRFSLGYPKAHERRAFGRAAVRGAEPGLAAAWLTDEVERARARIHGSVSARRCARWSGGRRGAAPSAPHRYYEGNVFHQSRVARRRRTRKLRDFRALHRLTAAARRVGRVWGRPRVSRQARWVIQSGRSSPTTCSSPAAPRAGTASSPATCRCSVGSDEPTPPTFARATRAARGPRCRRMKPVRARNARTLPLCSTRAARRALARGAMFPAMRPPPRRRARTSRPRTPPRVRAFRPRRRRRRAPSPRRRNAFVFTERRHTSSGSGSQSRTARSPRWTKAWRARTRRTVSAPGTRRRSCAARWLCATSSFSTA